MLNAMQRRWEKMKKKISKAKKPGKSLKKVKVLKAAKAKKPVKKMSKPELKAYKIVLLEQKREKLEELTKNIDDGKKIEFNEVKDSVDQASDTYDNEFLHNLSDAEKRQLEDIDHALEKIDQGAFGTCELCGKGISKVRLEAIPVTKYCIDCQTQKEK